MLALAHIRRPSLTRRERDYFAVSRDYLLPGDANIVPAAYMERRSEKIVTEGVAMKALVSRSARVHGQIDRVVADKGVRYAH